MPSCDQADELVQRIELIDTHIARCEQTMKEYLAQGPGKAAWLVTLGCEDQAAELRLLRSERARAANALTCLALEAHLNGDAAAYASVGAAVATVQAFAWSAL